MFSKKCKEHLKEVDMGAIPHMLRALNIAATFQMLVLTSIIHAFIPRLFTDTASANMKRLLNIKAAEEKNKND